MRNKRYKVKTIRLDDKNWEDLKELREELDLSWNLLVKLLLENYDTMSKMSGK